MFEKTLVSKNFTHKRGKGITFFRRKFFCLTVLKSFVGEPILVSENFWYRKFLSVRGGGGGREYHDFPSKIFCLTVPKIFEGERFSVSLIWGIKRC